MNEKFRRLALLVLCAVFAVSSGLLARDLIRSSREQKTNQDLALKVQQARESLRDAAGIGPLPELPASPYAPSGRLILYDGLWEENNDLAGWMTIEDTAVNYPVMYTPERPEKYLRKDFYGKRAISGTLFIGEGCTPDSKLVIVYGHNMRDGTMFSQLDNYQDEEFAKAHSVIHLDTLTQQREYEFVAAFRSQIYRVDDENVFRYYQYSDLSEPEKFHYYVEQVKAAALYDTGVTPQFGERLLVLSTCNKYTDNGRFVVVARQISQDVELLPED